MIKHLVANRSRSDAVNLKVEFQNAFHPAHALRNEDCNFAILGIKRKDEMASILTVSSGTSYYASRAALTSICLCTNRKRKPVTTPSETL